MNTGANLDGLDENDLFFSDYPIKKTSLFSLPSIKLNPVKQIIFNQGELKMCTACAVTTLFNFKYSYGDLVCLYTTTQEQIKRKIVELI